MANGQSRSIENVVAGDLVVSYDTASGHSVAGTVTRTFVHANTEPIIVINGSLKATANHPFYLNGGWVRADQLKVGDVLTTLSGNLSISRLDTEHSDESVYNLEVDGQHNYFAGGILVHNKPTP